MKKKSFQEKMIKLQIYKIIILHQNNEYYTQLSMSFIFEPVRAKAT